MMNMPFIQLENVSFSYDGTTRALDRVSLSIDAGEFVCILGPNGSGKSTLAKHLNALLVPDEGSVLVCGRDSSDPENHFEIRKGIGMVFQNPDDQLVASSVEDEVAFGPQNLGLPLAEIRRRVDDALLKTGLDGFEKHNVSTLSGGQKQRLAIAGALAMHPQAIVFDEASSMLDPQGRREFLDLCDELHRLGLSIIMITHSGDEAARARRVIVLDGGRVAFDGAPMDALSAEGLLERLSLNAPFPIRMSRALQARGVKIEACLTMDELVTRTKAAKGTQEAKPFDGIPNLPAPESMNRYQPTSSNAQQPFVTFDNVSFSYEAPLPRALRRKKGSEKQETAAPALDGISFDLPEGEIIGIAGPTGSGKSTLLQLCDGLLRPTRGRVLVRGNDIALKSVAVETRRQVGIVLQYPEHQLFAATVFDEVAFGPRNLGCDEPVVEQRVDDALAAVHLSLAGLRDRSPFALSGGQQRRVALASVLAMQPDLLLLDEPTAGLDPLLHGEFLSLIEELHGLHGLTCVLTSHDMSDLARICNRLLVLSEGRVLAIGDPSRIFSDAKLLEAAHLAAPDEYAYAAGIGFGVPANEALTIEFLASNLCL